MKHSFKHYFSRYFMQVLLLATPFVSSCSNSDTYSFKSVSEAINTCQSEYKNMQKHNKVSIGEFSLAVNRWRSIQDSAYAVFLRDSLKDKDQIQQFVEVADSIREKLLSIPKKNNYSMDDYLKFKLKTARNKKDIAKKDSYKKIISFYDDLKKEHLYSDYNTTISNYSNLIMTSKKLKKEQDLIKFIKNEDKCFRSLMKYLDKAKDDDLTYITEQTADVFEQLYFTSLNNPADPLNERILGYLSQRLIRRSILNSKTCLDKVLNNQALNTEQGNIYRWMILTPLSELDDYIMAYITPDQEKDLEYICSKLYIAMEILDGKNIEDINHEESKEKMKVISNYLFSSYIRTIL